MTRRLRVPRLALLLVLALAAPRMFTDPALADPSCPAESICFWTQADFQGERTIVLNPQPDPERCTSLSPPSLSAKNLTGRVVLLSPGVSCDGVIDTPADGTLPAGSEAPLISPATASFIVY
ncbi:MAG: peptidase inhibitor family I36 protein [Egibacteraceae bacterium]